MNFIQIIKNKNSITQNLTITSLTKITTRKNLIVSVGKTTEVTIILEMSTVEEEVTVIAETPVVDIETTKIAVHYSSEFIASIPYGRDLYDIQNSVPGAIVGGIIIGILQNLCGAYLDKYFPGGVKEIAPFVFMAVFLLFKLYGLWEWERIERV